MLIIIEGVDKTGKSTLARDLQEDLGGPDSCALIHFSVPRIHPVDEYVGRLKRLLEDEDYDHVVCDRGHIGEMIWPELFYRESEMTDAAFEAIEAWLLREGAFLVHCVRPVAQLEREFDTADPPEPLPKEKIWNAVQAFHNVVQRSVLRKEQVFYDPHQRPLIRSRLLGLAETAELRSSL